MDGAHDQSYRNGVEIKNQRQSLQCWRLIFVGAKERFFIMAGIRTTKRELRGNKVETFLINNEKSLRAMSRNKDDECISPNAYYIFILKRLQRTRDGVMLDSEMREEIKKNFAGAMGKKDTSIMTIGYHPHEVEKWLRVRPKTHLFQLTLRQAMIAHAN